MLAPEYHEEDTARIEVRELFKVPKIGVIAGSFVTEGEVSRTDEVRLVRDGTVVYEGKIGSLRRFKDDVKSVKAGYECGVGIGFAEYVNRSRKKPFEVEHIWADKYERHTDEFDNPHDFADHRDRFRSR